MDDYYGFYDEKGDAYIFDVLDYLNDSWELYKANSKLLTFEEAIAAYKEGKTICRKYGQNKDTRLPTKLNKNSIIHDYSFNYYDFIAKDWIICDE